MVDASFVLTPSAPPVPVVSSALFCLPCLQVTYGSTATISQLSTSFSKASFVARDQEEQVDLDDPDFWKKAIGLVEQAVPEEAKDDEVTQYELAFLGVGGVVQCVSTSFEGRVA